MGETRFTQIESERLILRRFGEVDLAPFMAYRNDPEVARYQSWTSCTEGEAKGFISEMKRAQPGTPGEWFQFALELKAKGALIGDCGLKTQDDARQAEVGFTLAGEYQGMGYATEAVSRVLDYAFEELGFHRVVAVADRENDASIALLERLGMRREGRFVQNAWFKGRWTDEYQYAMLRDEWCTKRRP